MTLQKGRSIELFYVNGHPDGMVTAMIPFQWTGHVLVTKRTEIKQALTTRPEALRPGIYMLVGEQNGIASLYIGETDEIKQRLTNHALNKDWWDTAILITANGDPLNKAHARYLEFRLYQQAKDVDKISVDAGKTPTESPLSDSAKAHMDDFLENIYLVLPALRFDFMSEDSRPRQPVILEPGDMSVVRFTFEVPRNGIKATARLEDGGFIVDAGSLARDRWSGSTTAQSTYAALFRELVEQGVLVQEGNNRKFARDYRFKSSSAAAAVTAGRPATGPGSWIVEGTNKSYGQWEKEQLDSISTAAAD